MSNEYKEANDERLMESVYEIVDSLTEPAARRLLEALMLEAATDNEDFAWTLMHQTQQFIKRHEVTE
jgi:hypothetical protein